MPAEELRRNVKEWNDDDTRPSTVGLPKSKDNGQKEKAIRKWHEQLMGIDTVDTGETYPTADMAVNLFDWSAHNKLLQDNIEIKPKVLKNMRSRAENSILVVDRAATRTDRNVKSEVEEIEEEEECIVELDDGRKELEQVEEKLARQTSMWESVMHLKSTRAYVDFVRHRRDTDDFGLPDFLSGFDSKRSRK